MDLQLPMETVSTTTKIEYGKHRVVWMDVRGAGDPDAKNQKQKQKGNHMIRFSWWAIVSYSTNDTHQNIVYEKIVMDIMISIGTNVTYREHKSPKKQ